MKKVTSALALAALVGTPAVAMANVEFGGDFDARAFATRNGSTADMTTGFDQRIRLQASFESDGGVQVHTRLNLMNDEWTGDNRGGVQTGPTGVADRPFANQDFRNVELDYGYVSIPFAGGRVNVGRQMASWGHKLTVTDDRRDRISYVRPLTGGHTLVALYDRRSSADDRTQRELDGNMGAVAFLGPLAENVTYGFLAVGWDAGSSGAGAAGYVLRGATLVSPYIEGQAGDFEYKVGGHYLGGSRGPVFTETTTAAYVKTGFQLTPEFKIEGQALHAMDGNLISGGYDTYSSLIHNSPDNNQSATRIAGLDLGGAGTEAEDGDTRTLAAARATYEMMDWTFMGAAGWVNYSIDSADIDEDVIFADLQAHYAVTPSTTVFATAGYAQTEDLFLASGGAEKDSYATSLNLQTQF